MDSPDEPDTVLAVVQYFLRFPTAADSLEGIVRWRLFEEQIHRTLDGTQKALDWLTEEGYVLREESTSTDPIYRLNPEKREAAAGLLHKESE